MYNNKSSMAPGPPGTTTVGFIYSHQGCIYSSVYLNSRIIIAAHNIYGNPTHGRPCGRAIYRLVPNKSSARHADIAVDAIQPRFQYDFTMECPSFIVAG